MRSDILDLVGSRTGHFRLESGHHAERWLDLERLCVDVRVVERLAADLAGLLADHAFDIVCGPLVEGAFVALMVASKLSKPFVYTERVVGNQDGSFFHVQYRLPASLRADIRNKRVAIVNDFTSAGSAVRGTVTDVRACGGSVSAIGSLVVLGTEAAAFCARESLPLETLLTVPFEIWEPSACTVRGSRTACGSVERLDLAHDRDASGRSMMLAAIGGDVIGTARSEVRPDTPAGPRGHDWDEGEGG